MEEEERAAQSAKLQELIRRGSPEDLREANRLMKVMAGYDTRHKTDYRAKAAEEVAKVQRKAKLLEEMLQNHTSGDITNEGDTFEVWKAGAKIQAELTDRFCRTLRMPFKVPILRYRKCARKNQTTQRRLPSYWKSMTVFIGQSNATS